MCSSKRKENIQETSNHQQTAGAEGGRGEKKKEGEGGLSSEASGPLKEAPSILQPLGFAFTFMKKHNGCNVQDDNSTSRTFLYTFKP